MHRLVLLIFLTVPFGAQAGQSLSESFVECAQLFEMPNRMFPERQQTEKGEKLGYAADQLMTAANAEAQREGRDSIPVYLSKMADTKAAGWDDKGMTCVVTEDFRDWMQYCRKLADHRGVSLTR